MFEMVDTKVPWWLENEGSLGAAHSDFADAG